MSPPRAVNSDVMVRFIERHARVKNKDRGGPKNCVITANRGQREASQYSAMKLEGGWLITIKARQTGFTTWCLCWCIALMCLFPGVTIIFVAPENVLKGPVREKWTIIWQSVARSLGALGEFKAARGEWAGIRENNKRHFWMRNDSRLIWASAGKTLQTAVDQGIGETADIIFLSEVAKMPFVKPILTAALPAMACANVIIDSTAPEQVGLGEDYIEITSRALSGEDPDRDVLFWPWWWREECRATFPARDLTDKELDLMARQNLDPFQIQWRRQKMASEEEGGEKFWRIYPETPEGALARMGDGAFAEAVLDELKQRKLADYPEPIDGAHVHALLPEDLRHPGGFAGDLFCSPKWGKRHVGIGYVRIWQPPQKGRRYWIGVDGSEGKKYGDWQVAFVVDEPGEHCATIRTRVPLLRFASELQRLGLWYNAEVEVEMDPRSCGAAICHYMLSTPPEAEVRIRYAHQCVMLRFPRRRLIERKTTKVSQIDRKDAFVDDINHAGAESVKDPDLARECIALDPETREKPNRRGSDDYLDGRGIAICARKRSTYKRRGEHKVRASFQTRSLGSRLFR